MKNSENAELNARANKLIEDLDIAMELENQSVKPEDIWNETGWIKKADGEWRFQ